MVFNRLARKPSWAFLFLLVLVFTLSQHHCNAQDDGSLTADSLSDDIFTKESPPTLSPDAGISAPPPPTLSPTPLPMDPISGSNSTPLRFTGHERCSFARDIYCFKTTQDDIDKYSNMSIGELEADIVKSGVSYGPLVRGFVDHWNSTTLKKVGWRGFAVSEETEKFEVRAVALGVVITSLSNIDSFHGTFDANLKLYFFNITRSFPTMEEAVNTVYKEGSRTTKKGSNYYQLHDHDKPDAWLGGGMKDGASVHPDGICAPQSLATMEPIDAEIFKQDYVRLPKLSTRIFPTVVEDSDGNLSWIEIVGAKFKYKPHNRKFFPVQTDMLDIFFEMPTTNLIHEDQNIVKTLMCLHPAYSGFASHVFGSDKEAGHSTSDSLAMIPYMAFERSEPWNRHNFPQFTYGAERQQSSIGNGNSLQRMLGLRIIVENPKSKGWFQLLPILFLSLTAVANFVSSHPTEIGATSMVQALLGANSLVTQNTQYLGQNTVMGQSLLLSYGINGLWISTVALMMLMNQAKKGYEHGERRWYSVYQMKIFRYLRLLASSACLLYIPLLSAYYIDISNGSQSRMTWVWGVVGGSIVVVFFVRVVRDFRRLKKQRRAEKEELTKEFSDIYKFSHKPLDDWDQDEVVRWVNIGSMDQGAYFSRAKRSSIAEKLKAACVDGEVLCQYGTNVDKLVQFVGLSFGDAVKIAEEVKLLVKKKTGTGMESLSTALVVVKNN